MYVDGSRVLSSDRSVQSFGWSVIALNGDAHHECRGHVVGGRMSPLGGHHEQIAIVNGVEYAHRNGFEFRDVTIFCDDDIFGYAQTFLHPGNFHHRRVDQIESRLKCVVSHCFNPEMMGLTMQALQESRIVKLKGHSRHVYQERADHLAKRAAHEGCGTEPKGPPLDIESWMCEVSHD